MSRKVLGLEIREHSLQAVLLDSSFKGNTVLSQGYVALSENKAGEEGIADALTTLVDQLKPAGASCVLGIPATTLSVRNLSVPFHDAKKIRQVLPFELEPSLPMPVEDLIVDFESVKQESRQDLLTFAVPREQIRRYGDLLGDVNLRLAAILPAGYAAARLIARMLADNSDFLFIDTGAAHHTVYAVSQEAVRLVRTFPVAGPGVPASRSLEANVKRTITALGAGRDIDLDPASVYSAGPGHDLLADKGNAPSFMGLPVNSTEALRAFPGLSPVPSSDEWKSGRFDIALSLALMEAESFGGVNFSAEQSALSRFWNDYRSKFIVTAALFLLAFATLMASQLLAVRQKQQTLADLDRQIESIFSATFPDVTRVVNPLQQMQVKIRETAAAQVQPELEGNGVRVIDILQALSLQIPKTVDVKINRMVVGTDNVVLSGNTANFNTVDEIKGKLEEATIFSSVTISSADLEKSGKRVRFKLRLGF